MKSDVSIPKRAESRDAVFIANRAIGHIELVVGAADGRTRREHVAEDGSLRARFPNTEDATLEAVIVNVAGGVAGGDRHALDIAVREKTDLVVTTATAEKIYRSLGPDAAIDVKLKVAAGARLSWLPQEMILFDRGRLSRRIDVELAGDATLTVAEMVVFGRSAMGESVTRGSFLDRWRVRRDGKLLFAETVKLDGAIAEKLAEPGVTAGGVAVATVLMVPGDEAMVERARTLKGSFAGEVGISAWNGIAVARFCAKDGASLRGDLIAVLTALGVPLPRLWLN